MLRDSVSGPKGAFQVVSMIFHSRPSAASDFSDTSQTESVSGGSSGGISLDTLVHTVDPAFIVEPA